MFVRFMRQWSCRRRTWDELENREGGGYFKIPREHVVNRRCAVSNDPFEGDRWRMSKRVAPIAIPREPFPKSSFVAGVFVGYWSFRRSLGKIPARGEENPRLAVESGRGRSGLMDDVVDSTARSEAIATPNGSRVPLLEHFRLSIHLETTAVPRTTVSARVPRYFLARPTTANFTCVFQIRATLAYRARLQSVCARRYVFLFNQRGVTWHCCFSIDSLFVKAKWWNCSTVTGVLLRSQRVQKRDTCIDW